MKSLVLLTLCSLALARRVTNYEDTPPEPCPHAASPPSKHVMCYYAGRLPAEQIDPCLCTHLVFSSAATVSGNYTLQIDSGVRSASRTLRQRNPALQLLLSVGGDRVSTEVAETLVKSPEKRFEFADSVGRFLRQTGLNGIELDFHWATESSRSSKAALVSLVKALRSELDSEYGLHDREKRDYDVSERIVDDITTSEWTPTRSDGSPSRIARRPSSSSTTSTEGSTNNAAENYLSLEKPTLKKLLLLRVPLLPEFIVKRFDLKNISRYVNYFTVPTHNISDSSETGVTYHPSRLMGLADILNTDSILDLLTGLGAPHNMIIISIPGAAARFVLKDAESNAPRSPTVAGPQLVTQSKLCRMLSKGGWTMERDEDLTAPYAFKNTTWVAFDDKLSVGIKSKYVLLRDLAGAALYQVDDEDWTGSCSQNSPHLLKTMYTSFTRLARKSRGALLQTLEEDIHESTLLTFSGEVELSPYRIVRVIDNSGAVHVVRKNAKTEFECSRQGYFSHPLGCNRFYRCVKFNQYSRDYTVFEYDCPAGLAFDERWEVCVWPGSLPRGSPCTGSSEIAPVPGKRYSCPRIEGYYADPENCRWFFACLDHARDGATPLTAYEFRCPFGLVFDESKLLCDWPWNVDGCGASGRAAFIGAALYDGGASRLTYEAGYSQAAGYSASSAVFSSESGSAHTSHGSSASLGLAQRANAAYSSALHSGIGVANLGAAGGAAVLTGGGHAGAAYVASGSRGASRHGVLVDSGAAGFDAGHGVLVNSGAAGLAAGHGVLVDSGAAGLAAGHGVLVNSGAAGLAAGHGVLVDSGAAGLAAGRSVLVNSGAAGLAAGHGVLVDSGAAGLAAGHGVLVDSRAAGLAGGRGVLVNSGAAGLAAGHGVLVDSGAAGLAAGRGVLVNSGAAGLAAGHGVLVDSGAAGLAAGRGVLVNSGTAGLAAGHGVLVDSGAAGRAAGRGVLVDSGAAGLAAGHGVLVDSGAAGLAAGHGFAAGSGASVGSSQAFGNAGGASGSGYVAGAGIARGRTAYAADSYNAGRQYSSYASIPDSLISGGRIEHTGGVVLGENIALSGIESGKYGILEGISNLEATHAAGFGARLNAANAAHSSSSFVASSGLANAGLAGRTVVAGTAVPAFGVQQAVPVAHSVPIAPAVPVVSSFGQRGRPRFPAAVPVVQPIVQPLVQPTFQPLLQPVQPVVQQVPTAVYTRPAVVRARPTVQPIIQPVVQPTFQSIIQPVVQPTVQSYIQRVQPTVQPIVQPVVQQYPTAVYTRGRPSIVQPVVQATVQPIVHPVVQQVPTAVYTRPAVRARPAFIQPTVRPYIQPVVQQVPTAVYTRPAVVRARPVVQPNIQPVIQPVVQSTVQPYIQSVVQPTIQPFIQPAVHPTIQPVLQRVQPTVQPVVQAIPSVQSYIQSIPVTTYGSRSRARIHPVVQPTIHTYVQPTVQSVPLFQPTVQPVGIAHPTVQPVLSAVPVVRRPRPRVQQYAAPFVVTTPAPATFGITGTSAGYSYRRPAGIAVTPTPIAASAAPVAITPVSTGFNRAFFGSVNTGPVISSTASPFITAAHSYNAGNIVVSSTPAPQTFVPVTTGSPPVTFSTGARGFQSFGGRRKGLGLISTISPIGVDSVVEYGQRPAFGIPAAEIAAAYPIGGSVYDTFGVDYSLYNGSNFGLRTASGGGYQFGSQAAAVVTPTLSYSTERPRSRGRVYTTAQPAIVPTYSTPSSAILGFTTPRPTIFDVVSTRRPATDYVIAAPVTSGITYAAPAKVAITPGIVGYTSSTPAPVNINAYVANVRLAQNRFLGADRARARAGAVVQNGNVDALLDKYSGHFGGVLGGDRDVFINGVINADSLQRISTVAPSTVGAIGIESTTAGYSSGATGYSVGRGQSSNGQYSGARQQTSRTQVGSGNVDALLDKYSGNFGGLLNGNKEGFISQVIAGNSNSRIAGRVSTNTARPVPSTTEAIFRESGYVGSQAREQTRRPSGRGQQVRIESPGEDLNVQALLDQYSGKFGGILTGDNEAFISGVLTGDIGRGRTQGSRGRGYNGGGSVETSTLGYSTTTAAPSTGATGRYSSSDRPDAPVVVITRLSDINPLLIAKLGAQCTCKSNTVTLNRNRGSGRGRARVNYDYDGDSDGADGAYDGNFGPGNNEVPNVRAGLGYSTAAPILSTVPIGASSPFTAIPVTTLRPVTVATTPFSTARGRVSFLKTPVTVSPVSVTPVITGAPVDSGILIGRSRRPQVLLNTAVPSFAVPVSTAAPAFAVPVSVGPAPVAVGAVPVAVANGGYAASGDVPVVVGAGGFAGSGAATQIAGRAFDRYGPGGWRSIDETLQGSVDCQRPGLFRHPKYCNKFYACHWDQWKSRYTLHVFNCPVHLSYDQSLGACNWPSQGPGCTDDNLLV